MSEPIIAGEYILGFHQPAATFLPEHFRTVWLDQQNGILAFMAKPRDQPETEKVHAIFFAKEKMWTQTKIKDWLSIHPDYMIPVQSPTDKTIERMESLNSTIHALTARIEKLERTKRRR